MRLIYQHHTGPRNNRTHEFQVIIDGKEYHIIKTATDLILINPDGERLYLDITNFL